MNLMFLQLAQTVTGNVATIVALELVAAIIGFVIAWYYARSVYTPVIKGLESDRANLNGEVAKLKATLGNLQEHGGVLSDKVAKLEKELAAMEPDLKEVSTGTGHIGKYVIEKSKNNEFYFNLKATNGQVVLTSVMFHSMAACTEAIDSVRANCADDNFFERKLSSNEKHYFSFKSSEGGIIGKSEMYESHSAMEKGIASVKKNGLSKTVIEE
jgi:uncharacterized protein